MADDQGGRGWDKVIDRLQQPSDWIAAGIGALAGTVFSLSLGGLDLGSSAAAGAIAGVTAKAAGEALLERPRMRKRAQAVLRHIENTIGIHADLNELEVHALRALATELEANRKLWEEKLISDNQFASLLDDLIERYRSRLVAISSPKQVPPSRALEL